MREPVFTGACTAMVTPFTQSGAVNYDQFAHLIDRQLEGGVDAASASPSTNTAAALPATGRTASSSATMPKP